MKVTPTWFGPEHSPLLGWVHEPSDGPVRGAVVICPPLGKEYITCHRALRMLADQLAAAGLVALRFDYPGTGDSSDGAVGHSAPDPDQLAQWVSGIVQAQQFLLSAGAPDVALVGLRIGATIAAAALPQCPSTSSLVLWDPYGSGREYLREQVALHRMSLSDDSPDDGSVHGAGIVFTPGTVAALQSLTTDDVAGFAAAHTSDDGQAEPVLLMVRTERVPRSLRPLTDQPGVRAEAVSGQAQLVDLPSYESVVLDSTLELVVQHLLARSTWSVDELRWTPQEQAVVARVDGVEVVERWLRVGPRELFAITTTTARSDQSWVTCLNVATDHHVGPGQMWVALARRGALSGLRFVRFDRDGVGESVRPGQSEMPLTYNQDSLTDVEEVLHTLGDGSTPEHVLIGLCSGAWVAAVAGIRSRAGTVVLVNPANWLRNPQPLGSATLAAGDERLVLRAEAEESAHNRKVQLKQAVKRHTPYLLWRQLGRLNSVHVPETLLRPLLRGGTKVHLLLGAEEEALFEAQRGPESLARLRSLSRGRLWVHHVPEADHSLQGEAGRVAVTELLLTELERIVRD